jgi:CarD family transcriptional regulator
MEFKIGQTVMHLSHGIGVIKSIEEREFGPEKVSKFYIIEIEDNGAPKKVFVPVDSAANRLRKVMTKADAQAVAKYLTNGKLEVDDNRTWNMRYRDYMERIHTGDAQEIATVYKSLVKLAEEKDLSFGERKLADQARMLLEKELDAAGVAFPEVVNG